jgi:hypothetical protein
MTSSAECRAAGRSRVAAPLRYLALAALALTCVFAKSPQAQNLPIPLTGPDDPDRSGYASLSFVVPKKANISDTIYDLHYELCNRRKSNLAFSWDAAGFGMDIRAPLPPGLCAIYVRGADRYKPKSQTTISFSDGGQTVNAYLPCEDDTCREAKPHLSESV